MDDIGKWLGFENYLDALSAYPGEVLAALEEEANKYGVPFHQSEWIRSPNGVSRG